MVDVNEGRRLLAESTDGPWEAFPNGDFPRVSSDGNRSWLAMASDSPTHRRGANADLIVWLRNNAEALLDAVEKVEAAVNRLNAASIPLGMTEAQFNVITLRDVRSILVSGVPE